MLAGWLVYTNRSSDGDWDVYLLMPWQQSNGPRCKRALHYWYWYWCERRNLFEYCKWWTTALLPIKFVKSMENISTLVQRNIITNRTTLFRIYGFQLLASAFSPSLPRLFTKCVVPALTPSRLKVHTIRLLSSYPHHHTANAHYGKCNNGNNVRIVRA